MKRIYLLLLVLLIGVLLISCNTEGSDEPISEPIGETDSTQEETTKDTDLLTAEEVLPHLREGMTYGELVSKIGEPYGDIGSGAIIYAWELADGQELCVYVSAGMADDRNEWIVTSFKIEENKSTTP